jgi:hypothetical protein
MDKYIKQHLLERKAEGNFPNILHCIMWLYDTGTYKLDEILDISKEIFDTDKINIDTTNITDEKTLFFINNINGCELKSNSKYPNCILFVKNNNWLFYLDLKYEEFVCHYDKIWSVFKNKYGLNPGEISVVIKGILETHLKLIGYTPYGGIGISPTQLET